MQKMHCDWLKSKGISRWPQKHCLQLAWPRTITTKKKISMQHSIPRVRLDCQNYKPKVLFKSGSYGTPQVSTSPRKNICSKASQERDNSQKKFHNDSDQGTYRSHGAGTH